MIQSFEGKTPCLGKGVMVADSALVLGDVVLGENCSIWYGAVVRGDVERIRIGAFTNVQDQCVIHVTTDRYSTTIGEKVTIGHGAIVHGCTLESRVLVGIGAIVMDDAHVGEGSIVAAGALIPPGKKFPPGSLIIGSPAQVKRKVTSEELDWIEHSANHYVKVARRHVESTSVMKAVS